MGAHSGCLTAARWSGIRPVGEHRPDTAMLVTGFTVSRTEPLIMKEIISLQR
jgi:hypothetical protein